jgi:hypothetical protein
MKKHLIALFFFLSIFSSLLANQQAFMPVEQQGELIVNNAILAKVNGNTISVLDVMKKMDVLFHKSYPQLLDSKVAKFQFYQSGWKNILNDMISTELMLAEAEAKEVKVTDSEIREELETRFGPNMMLTLDKIGITFQEAWKIVKNDMIVMRMNWFFVHSKTLQKVTPQLIRQAYREFCSQNPPKEEWTYQVITIKSDDMKQGEELSQKAFDYLNEMKNSGKPWDELLKLADPTTGCSLQISPEYKVETKDLSDSHRQVLSSLNENELSKYISQNSRFDKKNLFRIFFLKKHLKEETASFEQMTAQIKDELLQKVAGEEAQGYMQRLRKQYAHGQNLQEKLPDNFTPFEWRQ